MKHMFNVKFNEDLTNIIESFSDVAENDFHLVDESRVGELIAQMVYEIGPVFNISFDSDNDAVLYDLTT